MQICEERNSVACKRARFVFRRTISKIENFKREDVRKCDDGKKKKKDMTSMQINFTIKNAFKFEFSRTRIIRALGSKLAKLCSFEFQLSYPSLSKV